MNTSVDIAYCSEGVADKLLINTLAVHTHYTEQHRKDWKKEEIIENYARLRFAAAALTEEADRVKNMLLEDMPLAELQALIGKKYTSTYGTITLSGQAGKPMSIVDRKRLIATIGQDTFNTVATVSMTALTKEVGSATYKKLVAAGIIVDGTTVQALKYGKPAIISRLSPAEDK